MGESGGTGIQSRLVDLIRHGEVEGGPCFRGRQDDPLSDVGWAQLEAAIGLDTRRSALKKINRAQVSEPNVSALNGGVIAGTSDAAPWDRILCSPAARCARFANRLGARLGLPVDEVDALRERDFGAWEGLRADQIPLQDLSRFWADPSTYDPPDSETFLAFRQRVLDGWRRSTDSGAHLLLITHGGVIRVILGELLGIPAARLILLEVPPACHTRLRVPISGGLPSLIAHGCGPPDV
ncbi:MAG: histidine phosphatase family protein [Lamprobacter sp.]|uniref:histidine phosphatase family protein n=1 Tax=Lamprobacter sp. TaxID=3100796 RepID=UPI002B25C217|nr:histidine phosphatase family protein [Lamprobacter sp.]MEA3641771.1 histidine phosphatase family protein [Lamprobacter sp.]